MSKPTKIAVVDLFCGAGGTTTGVERARAFGQKAARVIACVNHDPVAIQSHASNHKGVMHCTEDIRVLNLDKIIPLVAKYRARGYKIALWASLECTNFSNAKGGLPRDADSRTLAEHLYRYIEDINPDYIYIENVREFMAWGPLDKNGKPMSRNKGIDYLRWVNTIQRYGYAYDYRILDSADYGAYTSRKRYFGVFAKVGLPIRFPQSTHAKNPAPGQDLFSTPPKKWKPVKEVLDFADEGKSIFNRRKPLSEKTLARIYAGLVKYVAGGNNTFLQKYYSGTAKNMVKSTSEPCDTITTVDHNSLVTANFIAQRNSGQPHSKVIPVDGPARTLTTTGGNQDLVTAHFMLKYNSTNQQGHHVPPSVNEPCPVVAAQSRLGIISANFVTKYYGTGRNIGMHETCSTLTTKDRLAKVVVKLPEPSASSQLSDVENPAPALTTVNKQSLVTATPFLMPTNYSNGPKSIHEPAPTITANRKHNYIVNPSWVGNVNSIHEPCPVIVARQDKAPLYLVQATQGAFNVPFYDTDSPMLIKIKEFMAIYGIVDIKMRMLKINELKKIQGFPNNYVLKGTQAQQKKFIGNSVVPIMSQKLIEATVEAITEHLAQAA